MQSIRMLLSRASLACAILVCASQALSQPIARGSLSNFDVWNRTGITANDFELELTGVLPGQISSLYLGNYPNASITGNGNPTVIRWTGSTTAPGAFSHFGVGIGNRNLGFLPSSMDFFWTLDGQRIGTLRRSWQFWITINGVLVRRDVIRNFSNTTMFVQRRVNSVVQPTMDLNELLRGGTIWNGGTLIDGTPVAIAPGEDLTFDFGASSPDEWSVMMYDQFDATGQIEATFLNAFNPVPEPGTLAVCGIGLVALLRKRRKS